jgi:hypothetical protein
MFAPCCFLRFSCLSCFHVNRLIVQSLPLVLMGGIVVVMLATRLVQLVQTHLMRMLPFGALSNFSLVDVCVGVLVSGLFMMYLGEPSRFVLHIVARLGACMRGSTVAPRDATSVESSLCTPRLLIDTIGVMHTGDRFGHALVFGSSCALSWRLLRCFRGYFPSHPCTVVLRSTLVPFKCIDLGATRVLESEPTVLCDSSVGPYGRMRAVGAATIVLYVLGLPAALATVLVLNWDKVRLDQQLRERGEGDSALTNPHFHFRRRFRKVYEDYRPALAYWKVVLLLRKLWLGLVFVLADRCVPATTSRAFLLCARAATQCVGCAEGR